MIYNNADGYRVKFHLIDQGLNLILSGRKGSVVTPAGYELEFT
jgi:hypothetical protein